MTVTTDVTTTGDTVSGRFTLKNLPTVSLDEVTKPAFAFAGLADLALEQVKEAPAAYVAEVKKVQERLAEVPAAVRTLPAQAKSLRGDVESYVNDATKQVSDYYGTLAQRGERLVQQIRRQPATEAALDEGKEAVKKVEAAAVAAKNSARATGKAARGAATKLG